MAESSIPPERHDVIIIGAGMCGISCAAALKTFGVDDFIILEKGNTINNFWKNHTYDRMSLHTPYHDMPFDGGLVYNYPQMKDKHQFTDYLQKYAAKYQLNSHIQFHKEVLHIHKTESDTNEWILSLQGGTSYICHYLCMATSGMRQPKIPRSLAQTMSNFTTNNGVAHSIQYKNGEKYKKENVLVIGNGDSAFEIAVDLVSHDANKVTMISPMPRHVIRLTDLNKTTFKYFGFAKKIGIVDIIMAHTFHVTPKHPKYNDDLLSFAFYGLDKLSIDLTKYGIPKPRQKVFKCNMSGNLQVLDWDNHHSGVDMIKSGRIQYICDFVERFDSPNLVILAESEEKELKEYDSVILCTGYGHGLNKVFDKQLFDKLFEQSAIYKTWGIVPKTDGYNQSTEDKTLFFLGLLGDFSVLSGYANGYWGWHTARTIATDKGIYDRKKEPSTWNPYTIRYMSMFVVSIGALISTTSYLGFKAYKNYFGQKKSI